MKMLDSIRDKNIISKCIILIISIIAALLIGAVFLMVLGVNPVESYYYLLIRPFQSLRSIGELSIKLTPILLIGIGVSFTFQAKLTNLGGEGQICLGAIGMTLVGISPLAEALGPWWILPGMLTAALFGALWAGIAGFFKTRFKASEIITTLLLNYIAVQFLSYCVYYPLRDHKGNIPQSAKVASTLPKLIEGSRMNAGVILAVIGVIIYWIIIRKTKFGYNLRVLGGSIKASVYGGISKKKYYLTAMLISGAFAGIAGSIEIAGTQTRLVEGLAGTYGFDGVVASLMGMQHPVGVLLSSILLAGLSVGAETMQVKTGVSSLFLNVLEALIVLFILLGFSFFNGKGGKNE